MKRIAASLLLTVILLGTYFLITISVRRYFLFGPGPFTIGKVATEYIVPRSGSNARTYDENARSFLFSQFHLGRGAFLRFASSSEVSSKNTI